MAEIHINQRNKTIKVVNRRENIKLKNVRENIKLQHTGKTGPTGPEGETGPQGLSAYQIAVAHGFVGTEAEWLLTLKGNQGETGVDVTYLTSFTVSDDVLVQHNLGKIPAVSILDSAGEVVEGDVQHIDKTSLRVRFMAPFSGQISCN